MPFVIAAFALIHIAAVHENGSNNPLGISSVNDKIGFFPYFVLKDSLSFVAFIMFFSFFVYFYPNDLGHPDNYIPGNPMVTPEHIVPEWYFLPSYAILRLIPNKLFGVLALLASILILLILPVVNSSAIRSTLYRPIHQTFF
jgi:ubiquinol-cytochrome c reductase cytochrome b subunit